MQQSQNIVDECRERVDQMDHQEVRSQLQQFLQNNPNLAPQQREHLLKNTDAAKQMLAQGLAQTRLAPIRQQIMRELNSELNNRPPVARMQTVRNRINTILTSETGDLTLVVQLMRELFSQEAAVLGEFYKESSQAQLVQQGKDLIANNRPSPEALANQSLPQEVMFQSFRNLVQMSDNYQDLRNQLATLNGGQQQFIQLTFVPFQQFLQAQGLDTSNFCPDQNWYRNLCTRSNINDASLGGLNLQQMLSSSPDRQVLQTQVEQSTARNRQQERHHRQEKVRLRREAQQLRTQAQSARQSGDTSRADTLEQQAAQKEREAQEQERLENYFKNVSIGSQEVLDLQNQSLRNANAEMALFPGHPDTRHMGVFGAPFTGLSHLFSKVGNWVPEPRSLYDLDGGDMIRGVGKVALAAAVLINVLKIGVGGWSASTSALGQLMKIPPSPINATKELLGGLKDTITESPGNLATAVISAGLLRVNSMQEVETFVRNRLGEAGDLGRRVAGNEYVSRGMDWANSSITPYLSRGYNGVKEWLVTDGAQAANTAMNWTSEQWESLKTLPGMAADAIEENQQFFGAMKALKSHLQSGAAQQRLTQLNLEVGSLGVTTNGLATLVRQYAEANDAASAGDRPIPLSLTALAEAGFLYRNNVRITKAQLEADDAYKALPEDQRNISVSNISDTLIAQRNYSTEILT
jgi:hypothetical protein